MQQEPRVHAHVCNVSSIPESVMYRVLCHLITYVASYELIHVCILPAAKIYGWIRLAASLL